MTDYALEAGNACKFAIYSAWLFLYALHSPDKIGIKLEKPDWLITCALKKMKFSSMNLMHLYMYN